MEQLLGVVAKGSMRKFVGSNDPYMVLDFGLTAIITMSFIKIPRVVAFSWLFMLIT